MYKEVTFGHCIYLSKLEKGSWVPSEIFYVKHSLRVRKIRKIYSKTCVNTISGSEVGNPT